MKHDKPHIAWSGYWGAFACSFAGLTRIGETPSRAYDAWRRAALAGNRR
jgi:hypothetical protein